MSTRTKRAASTPRCPKCRYDLRGATASWTTLCPIESTCPECGTHFAWTDVFRALKPIPLIEHATVWTPRVLLSAVYATLWPRRFWRRFDPNKPTNTARASLFAVLAVATISIVTIATIFLVFPLIGWLTNEVFGTNTTRRLASELSRYNFSTFFHLDPTGRDDDITWITPATIFASIYGYSILMACGSCVIDTLLPSCRADWKAFAHALIYTSVAAALFAATITLIGITYGTAFIMSQDGILAPAIVTTLTLLFMPVLVVSYFLWPIAWWTEMARAQHLLQRPLARFTALNLAVTITLAVALAVSITVESLN